MQDQATSLRELRANYDRMVTKPRVETAKDFLEKIKGSSQIKAFVLVYPDNLTAIYPEIENWLPPLAKARQGFYLWDQAGLIKSKYLPTKNEGEKTLPILPKQLAMLDLVKKSESEKCDFLRNMANLLDSCTDLCITMKASEISYYKHFIKSVNKWCIMLPDSQDSVIKIYEIIKNLHSLSNSPSMVTIVEFSLNTASTENLHSIRIKNVAKQFLGIDLCIEGVVLSNGEYIPKINEGCSKDEVNSKGLISCDFMYSFSHSLLYQASGTI